MVLRANRQDDEHRCNWSRRSSPGDGCPGIVNKSQDFRQSLILIINFVTQLIRKNNHF